MNIKSNVIANWKNRNYLNEKPIIIFCEQNNVDLNYIFTGFKAKNTIVAENEVQYQKRAIGLPLIPINAIAGLGMGDISVLKLDADHYVVPDFDKKADFLIKISGTSMSPKYFNGDVIACKRIPKDTFIQWGKVYVMDTVQGALCKRLFKSEKEGFVSVVSDDKVNYPEFEMPQKEIRSLAIVVGVIRLE